MVKDQRGAIELVDERVLELNDVGDGLSNDLLVLVPGKPQDSAKIHFPAWSMRIESISLAV